jgi:hypothetical protein
MGSSLPRRASSENKRRSTISKIQSPSIQSSSFTNKITPGFAALLIALIVFANGADAQDFNLRVMKTGLGSGTITSNVKGIDCGGDCDGLYENGAVVILTARAADEDSTFEKWEGDGEDIAPDDANTDRRVTMSADSSVRAKFNLAPVITTIDEYFDNPPVDDRPLPGDRPGDLDGNGMVNVRDRWSPEGIDWYLEHNQNVNTPAEFISALPRGVALRSPRCRAPPPGPALERHHPAGGAGALRAFGRSRARVSPAVGARAPAAWATKAARDVFRAGAWGSDLQSWESIGDEIPFDCWTMK